MAHYFVLFLLLGAVAASAALLPSTYGFVFAGEAWAHPMSNYSSARARESLRALYATVGECCRAARLECPAAWTVT